MKETDLGLTLAVNRLYDVKSEVQISRIPIRCKKKSVHKICSIIQNRSRLTPLDGNLVGTTVGLEEGETEGPFDGDKEGPFVIGRSVGLLEGCVEMYF